MLPEVVTRSLRDQRRALLVWAVALALLVAMYVAVYPSVHASSSFSKMIDQMPKAYKALFTISGGADISTPAGYLNVELLTFMGPLLVLIYAIGAGAAAVAGEEDRHSLDLLLANPISRGRVVVEKFAALAAGTVVLVTALWVALAVEGTLAGMAVPVANAAAAMVHLGLLGLDYGALALLVGGVTGRVAASRAVPAMLAVAAYLLNGFAPIVSWLRPIRSLSPFYQYLGHDSLRTGASGPAIAVTVVSVVVLVILAATAFARRDVLT
jgi:ABC-2 type transport system permease protein